MGVKNANWNRKEDFRDLVQDVTRIRKQTDGVAVEGRRNRNDEQTMPNLVLFMKINIEGHLISKTGYRRECNTLMQNKFLLSLENYNFAV